MKKVFTMLVGVTETERMEKTLNTFRIGLNDWDRSKAFDIYGQQCVNYTIICSEEVFNGIIYVMNGTQVY